MSENFQTPEPFVSTEEVAAFLGKPASWVYTRAEQHNCPRYRIGQHYRYRLSEVTEWIESGRAGSPQPGRRRGRKAA